MRAFDYSFECPKCNEIVSTKGGVVLAESQAKALERIALMNENCPLCGQSLKDETFPIKLYG